MTAASPWKSAYLGSALVAFSSLQPRIGAQHSLDAKKILKLCRIFQVEGCRRFDEDHRIRSIVTKDQYQEYFSTVHGSVQESGVTLPTLSSNSKVIYIHGRHRLAAAQAFLLRKEHWWPVDFYNESVLNTSGPALTSRACDAFENSQPFPDGIIFRQLLLLDGSPESRTWLARLTESKRRDYRQLRRQQKLLPLLNGFVQLTRFEGIWHDFKLGTFHRLLTLRCLEELLNYLRTIYDVWLAIVEPGQIPVDAYTVRALQGRAPRLSAADQKFIETQFNDGLLFSSVTAEVDRAALLTRCLDVGRIIPSLYTFTEDSKWIEPGCHIMRSLQPNTSASIRAAFYQSFVASEPATSDPSGMAFATAYIKLWLFVLRHFAELDKLQPRLDTRTAPTLLKTPSPIVRSGLTKYAIDLGFQVTVSNCTAMNETVFVEATYEKAQLTAGNQRAFKLQRRCGRMYESAYMINQLQLHYDNLREALPTRPGPDLACFAIARDIFNAFLRPHDDKMTILEDPVEKGEIPWHDVLRDVSRISAGLNASSVKAHPVSRGRLHHDLPTNDSVSASPETENLRSLHHDSLLLGDTTISDQQPSTSSATRPADEAEVTTDSTFATTASLNEPNHHTQTSTATPSRDVSPIPPPFIFSGSDTSTNVGVAVRPEITRTPPVSDTHVQPAKTPFPPANRKRKQGPQITKIKYDMSSVFNVHIRSLLETSADRIKRGVVDPSAPQLPAVTVIMYNGEESPSVYPHQSRIDYDSKWLEAKSRGINISQAVYEQSSNAILLVKCQPENGQWKAGHPPCGFDKSKEDLKWLGTVIMLDRSLPYLTRIPLRDMNDSYKIPRVDQDTSAVGDALADSGTSSESELLQSLDAVLNERITASNLEGTVTSFYVLENQVQAPYWIWHHYLIADEARTRYQEKYVAVKNTIVACQVHYKSGEYKLVPYDAEWSNLNEPPCRLGHSDIGMSMGVNVWTTRGQLFNNSIRTMRRTSFNEHDNGDL